MGGVALEELRGPLRGIHPSRRSASAASGALDPSQGIQDTSPGGGALQEMVERTVMPPSATAASASDRDMVRRSPPPPLGPKKGVGKEGGEEGSPHDRPPRPPAPASRAGPPEGPASRSHRPAGEPEGQELGPGDPVPLPQARRATQRRRCQPGRNQRRVQPRSTSSPSADPGAGGILQGRSNGGGLAALQFQRGTGSREGFQDSSSSRANGVLLGGHPFRSTPSPADG